MYVILVNERDDETGTMEKMEAHEKGLLHRAFSVFIFNPAGQMLLQKRADDKYHSGGLLTNACCSHPFPGEYTADAAKRRLKEEMGLDVPLTRIGSFVYRHQFENGLTEYEYDHVFEGTTEQQPTPDPTEAAGFEWMYVEDIRKLIERDRERFTPWFKIALEKFYSEQ